MNLIEKLGLEKCKQIVDGAHEGVRYYCASAGVYHLCDDLLSFECCISLSDLRAELVDHDRTDHCTDIKNHISPNTKVIEMSDLRERFERHQAGLLNIDYEELRDQFDRHEEIFGKRYVTFSDFEKEFELWQACWNHQQAKIEKLENELSTTKQVLGNVIDMEVAKVDNLKTQLNNMEAYYIQVKKERDELHSATDKALTHVKRQTECFRDLKTDATDMQTKNWWQAKVQILNPIRRMLEAALRGAND